MPPIVSYLLGINVRDRGNGRSETFPDPDAKILSHDYCSAPFPRFGCIGHAFVSKNEGVGRGVKISRTSGPHRVDRRSPARAGRSLPHNDASSTARPAAPRSEDSTPKGQHHAWSDSAWQSLEKAPTAWPHAAQKAARTPCLTARGAGSSTRALADGSQQHTEGTAPRTAGPHARTS